MTFIIIDPATLLDLQRLDRKFGDLSTHLIDVGTEAAGKYILMAIKKDIPPWIYVPRKSAYGVTFTSDAQRRYVMSRIRSGEIKIPYQRTGNLENGWRMIGSGSDLLLVNNSPAATWTMSEAQSRHEALVGWRKISTIAEEKERNAHAAAERAIQKEIIRIMG